MVEVLIYRADPGTAALPLCELLLLAAVKQCLQQCSVFSVEHKASCSSENVHLSACWSEMISAQLKVFIFSDQVKLDSSCFYLSLSFLTTSHIHPFTGAINAVWAHHRLGWIKAAFWLWRDNSTLFYGDADFHFVSYSSKRPQRCVSILSAWRAQTLHWFIVVLWLVSETRWHSVRGFIW